MVAGSRSPMPFFSLNRLKDSRKHFHVVINTTVPAEIGYFRVIFIGTCLCFVEYFIRNYRILFWSKTFPKAPESTEKKAVSVVSIGLKLKLRTTSHDETQRNIIN